MSDKYDDTNRGVLFRSREEPKTDKHPSHSGTINVEGREYRISGWMKQSNKTGEKFLSLAVTPKDAPKESKPVKQGNFDDMKDDIPW